MTHASEQILDNYLLARKLHRQCVGPRYLASLMSRNSSATTANATLAGLLLVVCATVMVVSIVKGPSDKASLLTAGVIALTLFFWLLLEIEKLERSVAFGPDHRFPDLRSQEARRFRLFNRLLIEKEVRVCSSSLSVWRALAANDREQLVANHPFGGAISPVILAAAMALLGAAAGRAEGPSLAALAAAVFFSIVLLFQLSGLRSLVPRERVYALELERFFVLMEQAKDGECIRIDCIR
jgi:hypothetical protein